jgi:phosphoserine phosphatase RsbU/P
VESGARDEQLLPRLVAVADSALAHLDADALMDELFERIEDLLDVDTVAVLLLDSGGTDLVAHRARGLEDEVRQGFRAPVGHGFAGRIAALKAPVVLDHVGPDVVLNPVLWRKGIQAMLGVPLISAGELVGVMHVGSLRPREFTSEDTALLQVAADRIAVTLVAERMAAERTAARTLQRSLLPSRLPAIDGLEIAARFVPAEVFGVGGDWYDLFVLPDGHIGVVVGDVAGHGLRAAVVMGRLRSVLRAYAMEYDSPAVVLDRLDRKFVHFEPDELATVVFARVHPDLSHLTLASAGHPPPIVACAGADAVYADVRPGPPICSHIEKDRADTTIDLPPGCTIGLYTDGLIERRHETLCEGSERLRKAFHDGPPDAVCTNVMADVIGVAAVEDDIALLVLRRTPM